MSQIVTPPEELVVSFVGLPWTGGACLGSVRAARSGTRTQGTTVAYSKAGFADRLDTTFAVSMKAPLTDERTNARALAAYSIKRVATWHLSIQVHAGMLVEELQRALGVRVPFPVDVRGEAAYPTQFVLKLLHDFTRGERG